MVFRLVTVSLFVAATAYAQAPGEVAPAAPLAAPADTACGGGGEVHESVMANRWAVGLSIGSLGIAPKDQPDNKTEFGVGSLSFRYRATLHLEIELAVGGGRQQLPDKMQGDLEVSTGSIGLRYRFAPEQAWNWWLAGAIGSLAVAPHDATDDQRKAAEKPMGVLGVGLERRFRHFAIDAELRVIGVGEKDPQDKTEPVAVSGGTMPMATTPPPSSAPAPQGQSGGQFTIGASYYF